MRPPILRILGACLVSMHTTFASQIYEDDAVLALTDQTLNSTLGLSGKSVLLEIYAPWCGHCRTLAPEYVAAAQQLAEPNLPVVLAKLDGTTETKTVDWLEAKGYPTLIWFSNGTRTPYTGGRTRQAITLWVKKQLGLSAESLETVADFERKRSSHEVFLLGFFDKLEGLEYKAFLEAAQNITDWPVFQTCEPAIAEALGLRKAPGFAVGTNFGTPFEDFRAVPWASHPAFQSSKRLHEQLLDFVTAEQLPPYLPYDSGTSARIFALPFQVFLVGPLEQLQPGGSALKAVEEAHSVHKGRIAFATAAQFTDPADMLIEFFALDRSNIAESVQVVAFHPEEKKYLLLEPLTAASLLAFCNGVIDGTYHRLYKSAPLPKIAKESYVTVVVGRSFADIVLDPSKDVLLMVYTTWSEKSKHLAAVWKKLARHLRHAESVVVSKMEAGGNEHSKVPGTAVPSIWLFPARASGEGLKFSGTPTSKICRDLSSRPVWMSYRELLLDRGFRADSFQCVCQPF